MVCPPDDHPQRLRLRASAIVQGGAIGPHLPERRSFFHTGIMPGPSVRVTLVR
jgi:hypothetical protein